MLRRMESSFVEFAVDKSKLAGHLEYERSPALTKLDKLKIKAKMKCFEFIQDYYIDFVSH